jgi:hypothetical protein
MKRGMVRLVSGVFGIIAAVIAVWVPLIFVVSEIKEMHSYEGPISVPGAIGGSLLIVAISAAFGFGAYKLLMRAAGKSGSHNLGDHGSGENLLR